MKAREDDIALLAQCKHVMPKWHHVTFENGQAYEIIENFGETMETLKTFIGTRILALRKAKGLSQADLADRLKCEIALISRYERGVNAPSIEQLLNLANALDIPPADLLPSAVSLETEKIHALQRLLAEKAFRVHSVADLERLVALAESFILKK
jgi:transcriptional regulator with XRE-family HTH domain